MSMRSDDLPDPEGPVSPTFRRAHISDIPCRMSTGRHCRRAQGQGADAAILNAGVSGDTTAGGLARIGWTLTDEVDALIVALGGNDALRGLDPAEARANLDAILGEAGARDLPVLLVGIGAPGNFGPDYRAAFEAIYRDLAATHDTLLVRDFLAPIVAQADRAAARAAYMQADGLHPNADGVALIVAEMGPAVLALIDRTAAAHGSD
jgi:acyl-CoA thioesterase-1